MSDGQDGQLGFASLAVAAGLVVAIHLAPGPRWDDVAWWAGTVKVAHGYLACMGVSAGAAVVRP